MIYEGEWQERVKVLPAHLDDDDKTSSLLFILSLQIQNFFFTIDLHFTFESNIQYKKIWEEQFSFLSFTQLKKID